MTEEGDRRVELKVDGYSSNIQLMTNQVLLHRCLYDMVQLAGMHQVGDPIIKAFAWPGSRDTSALSAYQFIRESGIDVHCHPERQFVFVTVFSCKDFDHERMTSHIIKSFNMRQPKVMLLNRGINEQTGAIIPVSVRS